MYYKLIETNSVSEMARCVKEALADGWKLYGNLVVYRERSNSPTLTYYREMVKDKVPFGNV